MDASDCASAARTRCCLSDCARVLPRAEDAPESCDLGRNGTYLVMRQLSQDVYTFWQALDRYAGGAASTRERLASAMVGRRLSGEPLVEAGSSPAAPSAGASKSALNEFNYLSDPEGIRCPLGAHIRRSNPRIDKRQTATVKWRRRRSLA